MNYFSFKRVLGVCSLLSVLGCNAALAQSEALQSLAEEAAQLEAEIALLEAENEIENLQRIFGFYIDKRMWPDATDLFTDDATIEISGEGVYQGAERIYQYLSAIGNEGPAWGILYDQMQLQPVVHVQGDGTAKGRWHHFSQEAVHGESHHWGTGVYENEYRREGGIWKISKLHLYSGMRTSFDQGWHKEALPRTETAADLPPDAGPSVEYANFPSVHVVPFHYGNPVTEPFEPTLDPAPAPASSQVLTALIDELDTRMGLLEDADELERLHSIYGYYLARKRWDDLAGIFARNGTIEIAQRGVYRGQASVRRNLDLYGLQDVHNSELHNHMQYQPVIHVAADGQSAMMRSRALSMMGTFGNPGIWMGGVYENTFIKEDGVWKINTDQQFNTYFVGFDVGWKDLAWRPAPGINESNPPDEPPSAYFEMYPRPFLPPYHYDNPVTGEPSPVWQADQARENNADQQ